MDKTDAWKKKPRMCPVTPAPHGLTMETAEATGYSHNHITMVIRGDRKPGKNLRRLMKARGFKFGRDGMVVRGK